MSYRWEDFTLDMATSSLSQHGRRLDLSPKVVDCIGFLMHHRERVVGHDELIRALWGHVNVTNHQLAKVVLAARRVLGDDGQSQRCIRTVPGRGYHWVGPSPETGQALEAEISPVADHESVPSVPPGPLPAANAQALDSASVVITETVTPLSVPPTLPAPQPVDVENAGISPGAEKFTMIGFCLMLALLTVWYAFHRVRTSPEAAHGLAVSDPIAALKDALWMGRFEDVREGLAKLPPSLVDTPDARFIEIELELQRGRYLRAKEKSDMLQTREDIAKDPVAKARLLAYVSRVNALLGKSAQEVLGPAQSALDVIESSGKDVPPDLLASALYWRANGHLKNDNLDKAEQDLLDARDLFVSIEDERHLTNVESALSRVWMRTGRMHRALEALIESAAGFHRLGDATGEIYAHNRAARVQMELLRWDDGLVSCDRSMALLHQVPDLDRRARTLQLRAMVLISKGRLREAASDLDESKQLGKQGEIDISSPWFHLENGEPAIALEESTRVFDAVPDADNANILLDSKDGALLVWVTAAQALARAGRPLPTPGPAQWKRLHRPATPLAHIANGRWSWQQGQYTVAEAELRLGLSQARKLNQLYRMTLAAEPLTELLLQRGDIAAARAVHTDMRAFDPGVFDGDYRVNLIGLRIALAEGDRAKIAAAYTRTRMLAGERRVPGDVASVHAERRLVTNNRHAHSPKPDTHWTGMLLLGTD